MPLQLLLVQVGRGASCRPSLTITQLTPPFHPLLSVSHHSYYSYKWAEVLSADAFAAFEEAGLEDEGAVAATGRRFADTVLGLGGGRAPQLVFQDFRWAGTARLPACMHACRV